MPNDRKCKKINISEIEVLVGEVETRKIILLDGRSSGVTNKKNAASGNTLQILLLL